MLDVLERERIRITFFLTGEFIERHQGLYLRIAAHHELANHSYSHVDFTTVSPNRIKAELEDTERLANRHGLTTKPYWRAPSGARNAAVLQAATEAGWPTHVFWSLQRIQGVWVTGDAGDWQGLTADEVLQRVLHAVDALGNGTIIVQHCNSTQTEAILPQQIAALRARGFEITTVSGVLAP
jgi:peptidoglycan/xylan/chitin deacetylase (PgdA/CDA1 family)